MSPETLLRQARAGEADAIAALLIPVLTKRALEAQVRRQGGELQVIITGVSAEHWEDTVELILKGLERIQPAQVERIRLVGRANAHATTAWEVKRPWKPAGNVTQPVSEAPAPLIDANSHPPIASSLEPTVDASWQQAARAANYPQSEQVLPTPPFPHSQFDLPLVPGRAATIWQPLVIGGGLALAINAFPLCRFLLHPLITLVHELGHAATAWLFGYLAIPAFDFVHGGGVTGQFGRLPSFLVLVYAGCGYLYYRFRDDYGFLRVLLALILIYTFLATTDRHTDLITAMGHGAELGFAGLFLYRSISGHGCRYPGEQSLYAMMGWFIWLYDLGFAWQLLHNVTFRANYLSGKGGLVNDLVILAGEYAGGNLSTIATLFLACTAVVPPFVIWLYWRSRERKAPAQKVFKGG